MKRFTSHHYHQISFTMTIMFFMFLIMPKASHARTQQHQLSPAHLQTAPSVTVQQQQNNLQPPKLEQLSALTPDLERHVLLLAKHAYCHALHNGEVRKPILTIIDFHRPSSQKRLWVIDLEKQKLLFNTFVAHGRSSGNLYAHQFSNTPQSKASSLGTFVTQSSYIGGKGLSLNLKGLEPGFNNNAYARRVVMHGAWYVDPHFIHQHGQAGRSWGCPAVSPTLAKPLISTIKDGAVVFAYYPDKKYMAISDYI